MLNCPCSWVEPVALECPPLTPEALFLWGGGGSLHVVRELIKLTNIFIWTAPTGDCCCLLPHCCLQWAVVQAA